MISRHSLRCNNWWVFICYKIMSQHFLFWSHSNEPACEVPSRRHIYLFVPCVGHPYSSDESGQSGYPSHLRRSLMHDPSLHANSLSAHTGGPSVHKHNKTTVTGYTWSKQVCGCLSHFQFQTVMFLFNNREFADTIEFSRCGIRDEPKMLRHHPMFKTKK